MWLADAADPVRVPALPPLDRLADMLASRQLVLVLDNCEHLIGAVAQLADRILAVAPGVRILATSREPLGVTGETLCPVPSLPLPPDRASPAEAMEYGGGPAAGRAGGRGPARLHHRRGQHRAGHPDLPRAGRQPAGHRAGRGPAAVAHPGPGGGPA